MQKHSVTKLREDFYSESWILWLPVLYTIGIIINLSIKSEIKIIYPIIIDVIALILLVICRKKIYLSITILSIFSVISGFLVMSIKTKIVKSPILRENIKYAKLTGTISSITPLVQGSKVIISSPVIEKYEYLKLKNIRLNIRTDMANAKIGDKISISASLSPPSKSSIIGGYNFAFYAYFFEIGAVGFSLSKIKIVEPAAYSFFSNIRRDMGKSIIDILGARRGNIATALMIGDYTAIDKKILQDMRISGISHILSVSGMHLSLAAMIFLFSFRIIFNLVPYFRNWWDVKKIASIFALLGSFGYLLISGLQIAAIRSFIMSSMIIFAIIIDRLSTPLRSVMFAFLILLIIYPESIVNPSFQMSFAAVIALISCYESYSDKINIKTSDRSIVTKIFLYTFSTLISSIIASIATAPYAAYHFNQFSGYGFVTNLLAVPLTSFLIMPAVIFAFLFYPISLHKLPLIIMGWGIEMLIKMANFVSNLPGSTMRIAYITPTCIILITLSGLVFTLLKSKLKSLSLVLITMSLIIYFKINRQQLIVTNKNYAYIKNNELIVKGKKPSSFARDAWLNYTGKDKINYSDECNSLICQVREVLLVRDKLEDCPNVKLIIDWASNNHLRKCNAKYLNIASSNDIYIIDLKTHDVSSNNDYIGNRAWN